MRCNGSDRAGVGRLACVLPGLLLLLLPTTRLVALGGSEDRPPAAAGETSETVGDGGTVSAIPDKFTVAVYYEVRDETDDLSAREVRTLVDTLIGTLSSVDNALIFRRFPSDVENFRSYTFDRNAYGWLEIDFGGNREEFSARVRSFSVLSAVPSMDQSAEGPFDDRLRILSFIWSPLAERFERSAKEIVETALAEQRTSVVTFYGEPGTQIVGITDEPQTIGSDGELSFELLIPFAYDYEARGTLRYPRSGEVFLGEEDQSVELGGRRKSRFFFDGSLSDLAYPDITAGFQPVNDFGFVQLGIESYIAGFVPIAAADSPESNPPVFVSEPISNIHLQAGRLFRANHANLRPFVSAGPFMRLVHGPYWGPESQSPGGVQLRAGAEIGSRAPWRFQFSLRPTLYLTGNGDEFAVTVPSSYIRVESDIDPGETGLSGFFDLFALSVGARFQPQLADTQEGR
ncbi:MAG: hypothetical protein ACOCRN_02270 [Spirochaetia bacterium]